MSGEGAGYDGIWEAYDQAPEEAFVPFGSRLHAEGEGPDELPADC